MKLKKFLIICILPIVLNSCNDWLDVDPQDTVTEEELFSTYEGYRNALHGVYRQMSSYDMYGQEMSWGLVDVMGQLYYKSRFKSSTAYRKIADSYAYTDKRVKPITEGIWTKTYNCIANCNNLITKLQTTDPLIFPGAQEEKNLIEGEALALRALLHFDMLRLFAPSPEAAKNDDRGYIPYFSKYPSTFEPDRTVTEILNLVEQDLLKAKNLVGSFDTLPAHVDMLNMAQYRYYLSGESSYVPKDLFYRYRGYRMNYYAVTALLARVYNYMGKHEEAYKQANEVIDAAYGSWDTKVYSFTDAYDVESNKDRKMYEEIIFTLSNTLLLDRYKSVNNYNDNSIEFTLMTKTTDLKTMFDDGGDCRGNAVTELIGSYRACNKLLEPTGSAGNYSRSADMIPMIRLGEMYYIKAEYLFRNNDKTEALKTLDDLREARGCEREGLNNKINDLDSFLEELIKEAKREFMQEGQLFYYYKRLNIKPVRTMPDNGFVIPLPDNELIN